MEKRFELSYKELLDKLFQIQTEMNQAQKEDNDTLYRMLELDMYNILDHLNLRACDYCQYNVINKNKKCDLDVRCQSYLSLKNIIQSDDDIRVKLEFIFKLI